MPDARALPPWQLNAPAGATRPRPMAVLWHARDLIGLLVQRDLRVRYRQAVLGVVWVLGQPLVTAGVFTLVFSRLAGIGSDGVPYLLFALVGMALWTYFAAAVSQAADALVQNPELVTKVAFPRLAAPVAALLSPLLDLAVTLVLVGALLVVYRRPPGLAVLATPLWLALLVLIAFGLGVGLAALNVRFRDVRHALSPLLQIWLFASPVAYPVSLLPGWAATLAGLNPMVGVLGLARWSLLGAPWPGWSLAVSVAATLVVVVVGVQGFSRSERLFADVI